MGAHYDHFSLADRREIFRLREAKLPVRVIAERLGRHRSSIHRELRRNWFQDGRYMRGYFPITAQELTTRRRRRLGLAAAQRPLEYGVRRDLGVPASRRRRRHGLFSA